MVQILFYGGVAVGLSGIVAALYFGRKPKGCRGGTTACVAFEGQCRKATFCDDGKCVCIDGKRYELAQTGCGCATCLKPENAYGIDREGRLLRCPRCDKACCKGFVDATTAEDKANGLRRSRSSCDGKESVYKNCPTFDGFDAGDKQ